MSDARTPRRLVAAGVFVIVAAAFASTIGHYLVWSDFFQIDQGHMIVRRWEDVSKIWLPDQLRENNYLRPVQVLSNTLDGLVWGQRWAGFHATSVLLHAGNAVLLFLVGCELLERGGRGAARVPAERVVPVAAAGAVLWGIHTWKTESVAWIADRCNVLQGFSLLALLVALRALRRADETPATSLRTGGIALCALAFLAGLLSKETAIVLPALLVLAHWLGALRVPRRAALAVYGTLGGLAIGYLVVRRTLLWYPPSFQVTYGLGERFLTELVVLAENLRGVFWPFDPRASDVVRVRHGLDGAVALALCALLTAGGLALLRFRRGDRRWAFALGWFLVCLAPTANLVSQRHFRGDRYLYLASFAPILVSAWAADGLLRRLAVRSRRLAPMLAPALFLLVAVPVLRATLLRNAEWRANDANNEHFFALEVARSPGFREGLGNLCRAKARSGQLDEALVYCRRGWAIDEREWTSTAWQPQGFLALTLEILTTQHDCPGALALAREAVTRWPREAEHKRRLAMLRRSCDPGLTSAALTLPDAQTGWPR